MKNQKGSVGIAIVLIMSLFMIMVVTIIVVTSTKDQTVEQEEWCEVGTVNSDGSISYNGKAGTTELVAFATVDGPKLMAKCE